MWVWKSSRTIAVIILLGLGLAGATTWFVVAKLLSERGYGGLYFSSVPSGAILYIDGDSIGVTPLLLDSILSGNHVIRLSHPYYEDLVATVEVRDSMFTRIPHIVMRNAVGTISIRSEPSDASLWFDGRNMGRTPRTLHNIPYGEYDVLLVKSGYAEETHRVEVSRPRTFLSFPMHQGVFHGGSWVLPEVRDSIVREQQVETLRGELEQAVEARQWNRAEQIAARLRTRGAETTSDTLPSVQQMRVEDIVNQIRGAIRANDWDLARNLNRSLFLLDVRAAAEFAPQIRQGGAEAEVRDQQLQYEELLRLFDEAIAQQRFERALSLLRSLAETDPEEAERRRRQLEQARQARIELLERRARARWLERDRLALNRVMQELVRIDPTNPAHESYRHMPGQVLRMRTVHTGDVWSVAVTPDGQYIVSGSYDDTVRLWRVEDGRLVRTMSGHTRDVQTVAVTPDGRYIVSAGDDKTVRVWELSTGECIRVLQGHTDIIWSVAVSADGRYIISGSYDGTIRMWEMERILSARPGDLHGANNSVRRTFRQDNEIFSVVITPDGRYVLSANGDDFDRREGNAIRVWDTENGEQVRVITGHTNDVSCIALTPDGSRVVSASLDGTVRLWNVADGRQLWSFDAHGDAAFAVTVTPDGRRVLSGGSDNNIRVLNIDNGAQQRILRGHHANVYALAVTPDGRYIISGSRDKTLKVWRAPW